MDISVIKIKKCIYSNDASEMVQFLNSGFDPNFEGGWPIRLGARLGSFAIVRTLIQYGANPHLLSESGASTLQLAVYSGLHWNTDQWSFLLPYCDSSQLADGAAVAIIFNNEAAFKKILSTGRCNTNIPTSLTGKTLEVLAKGYQMYSILSTSSNDNENNNNVRSPGFNIDQNLSTVLSTYNKLCLLYSDDFLSNDEKIQNYKLYPVKNI